MKHGEKTTLQGLKPGHTVPIKITSTNPVWYSVVCPDGTKVKFLAIPNTDIFLTVGRHGGTIDFNIEEVIPFDGLQPVNPGLNSGGASDGDVSS